MDLDWHRVAPNAHSLNPTREEHLKCWPAWGDWSAPAGVQDGRRSETQRPRPAHRVRNRRQDDPGTVDFEEVVMILLALLRAWDRLQTYRRTTWLDSW